MHSFVVKMPSLTSSCQYANKGPKTGARGHYSTTSTPVLSCRHSRRLVLSFLCIMTNEHPSYPIVLDRTGLTARLRQTTRAGTSLFWWWADFRMRESRAKVRHSDQTQGDWPRNAPHVQCEQTDYSRRSFACLLSRILTKLLEFWLAVRTNHFAFQEMNGLSRSLNLGVQDLVNDSVVTKNSSDVFAEQLMCGAAQTRIIPGKRIRLGSNKEVSWKSAQASTYQNKKCDGSSHIVNGWVSIPSPLDKAV